MFDRQDIERLLLKVMAMTISCIRYSSLFLILLLAGACSDIDGRLDEHTQKGLALESDGQYEDAIRHLREAVNDQPQNAEAHRRLAHALRSGGQLDDAIAQYRLTIQLKPDHAVAHN